MCIKAVEIDTLNYKYDDGTVALDSISLTVNKGESLGIIGANGAGKSTLVNHLNGYFLPQSGLVKIHNIELSRKTQEQVRQLVGVVFQVADDQLFMPRIYDDIAFGPRNLGLNGKALEEAVEDVLRKLGLWELRDRAPSRLSAGQKRFCSFATVLVMQPSIIVMDEPTSDLDPRHRRQLINFIRSFNATKITVSHDLDFIWDICDRVVIMFQGKIVVDGLTKDLLNSKALLEKYELELPLRFQK